MACRLQYLLLILLIISVVQFAERLISKMPGLSRVYYSSSGSEANEKAFKMVRQISQFKYGGKKKKILYRERDYHGTTISTLSASGQEERKEVSAPLQHARTVCVAACLGRAVPGMPLCCFHCVTDA